MSNAIGGNSGIFGSIQALGRSLDYHLRRHGLLTSNIANAETPGYRPRELKANFQSTLHRIAGLQAARTHAMHLSAGIDPRFEVSVMSSNQKSGAGANGNMVDLEGEMAKLAANSLRYQASTEMLRRRLGMVKYAATDGRRR